MNKRSAPRFPVNLEVDVTFPGQGKQTCTLRDYCSGGMYLLCDRANGGASMARAGDTLQVEFEDPLMPRAPHHRLSGRIVRFESHGMGLAFSEVNNEAIIALSQLAASQSAGGSGVAGTAVAGETYGHETISKLTDQLQRRSTEQVRDILGEFFRQAKDQLFDAAERSGSNVQQLAFFGAMNELRKAQEGLSEAFMERFSEQFEALSTPGYSNKYQQEADHQSGLSLVESDELDNWLAVRAMSAKLEGRLEETLEALEMRLEEISANPITLENNPVGPFVFASVFREMLGKVVLEDAARKVLFTFMEELLKEKLKPLYDELNEILIANGILPTIQKKMEVVKKPGGGGYHSGAAEAVPQSEPEWQEAPGPEGGQRPAYGGAPQGASGAAAMPRHSAAPGQTQAQTAGYSQQGAPVPATGSGGASSAQEGAAQDNSASLSYTRPSGAQGAIAPAVAASAGSSQAIQELVRLQQQPQEGQVVEAGPPPAGYYSSGQVVQALEQIDKNLAGLDTGERSAIEHVNQLAQALEDAGGEAGMALSENDRETVTYVGGMFSSIHRDQYVAEQARPWFQRLEVPLLKAGILDPSLMEDEAHPARELLNRLEAIGDLLQNDESPAAQEARRQIEAILAEVEQKVESEPEVFSEALGELEQVQESVEGNYEENVKKLIQQCEQEKAVEGARKIVLDELNHRLGKREVPKFVLNLLDSGWKNLLLRTLLRSGADSPAFKTYLNVIDLLTARLSKGKPYSSEAKLSDEELVEWTSRMLGMVSSNEQKNALLVRQLAHDLAGQSDMQPDTKYVPGLVAKGAGHGGSGDAHKPDEVAEDVWQLMLEDAKQLTDREVFSEHGAGGKSRQVTFVWRDDDNRFVFADNIGNKALDLELAEVANALYDKSLSRVGEKELSLTERATYSFLQSLHSQIAYQAHHDELTGLFNRKAFELELDKALESAQKGETTHVLGYFDLDRFNIINTTCGHAEGDVLLSKVAEVLCSTLPEGAVVARLGGDEFGVILPETSRIGGLKSLTELHDSIREIRFACDNNEFKVTCSMGVTEINEASESAGRLLSAVDSAAFTAKDNGRDNIQIHNVENERISSRRHILDWVGRINVLFDKGLIQLRCQKIAPFHTTVNSLPHYEVLLDVHDEQGNKVPLEEFIVAAERYNRILDIDNWVVGKIFDWLETHKGKLDRISNLSVNLSGSSLGNRQFIEQIYQRLSKPEFPADKVCFEVTETIAMAHVETSARFMEKLKQTGCHFSLDDFGSGTSSYAYLRSLPIDYLKIDGAFIKDIATNTSDYAVVKSINEIGHVMGKLTVAEMVEDDFAYQLLHDIGIDYAQGFGVEKPIPLEKLFS